MNKNLVILLAVVGLVLGGVIIFGGQNNQESVERSALNNDAMEKESESSEALLSNDIAESNYLNYSQAAYDASSDKTRVLYFYANWCPTCKVANAEFSKTPNGLPEDVVIFRINYNDSDTTDEHKELAKKYDITYQHTFVQVDQDGNEITKWNGGGVIELKSRLK